MSRVFIQNVVHAHMENVPVSALKPAQTARAREARTLARIADPHPGRQRTVLGHTTKPLRLSQEGLGARNLVGRGGFEPPKASANRFTVCPR